MRKIIIKKQLKFWFNVTARRDSFEMERKRAETQGYFVLVDH